jgi:hypothetical protein
LALNGADDAIKMIGDLLRLHEISTFFANESIVNVALNPNQC